MDINGKVGRNMAFLLNLEKRYVRMPTTPGKRNKTPITRIINTGICCALKSSSKPTNREHSERKMELLINFISLISLNLIFDLITLKHKITNN